MTTPDPTPAPASAADVLEMLARAIETERDRQKCGVFFSDLAATLDPAHLRALAQAQPAPPPVEEISAEEFARRESPHWAHVENAVEYVRAGRGDPQPAPAPTSADAELREELALLRVERDAYWRGVTHYANLQTNYRGAITRDMLDEIWQTVEQITDRYGCAECAGRTFEDGMICCWTCGREMPDAQAQAEGGA